MQLKLAASMLLGATSLFAQCNTSDLEIRTFSPTWSASFYYPSANGETLNQFMDLTVGAPLTVNSMTSTTYDQAAGATTPPDQIGNVVEVRLYTFPVTHAGNEGSMVGWTEISRAEMTLVAWSGDCLIQNFKDPVSGLPTPLVLPTGSYGLCLEYIPTSWAGTAALPQTQPILNPGSLSCLAFVPPVFPGVINEDQFVQLNQGAIQTAGWQTVDPVTFLLGPTAVVGGIFNSQPNIGINYTPDAAAGSSETIGAGCYNLPFMIYEQFPVATTPVDLENLAYTAVRTPSANGGFYSISAGGIAYASPPAALPGLENLTLGGAAPAPIANSSGNVDDCTWARTIPAMEIPGVGGGLLATELGINSNGKVYFDVVPATDTSYAYNGANYGDLAPFRDLAAQWAIWNTDLDPSTGVGDVYYAPNGPTLGGPAIWWDGVPNWPAVAGAVCSCSIEFTPDGSVCNIAYGTSLVADGGDVIVGFSAGNGEPLGIVTDWSAITSTQTGDGSSAPTLDLSARPVDGTTFDFVIGNLPETAVPGVVPNIGLVVINTIGVPGGLDLGFFLMPGCDLYVGGVPVITTVVEDTVGSPGELRLPFPVPIGFGGTDVYVQGAVLHQVFQPNPRGITVSNAVCFTLGSI